MTQKYQVKVSMKQAAIVETGIVLKQGDFGMQIEIEVLDFDVTGTTPQIVFRKAMGAVESTTITVSGNKYTYTFKGTELDTPGKCFCDLKLKNSTTQRISTASFMFRVVADTMDGLNEQASSYSDTIAQIVGEFDDDIAAINTALDNLSSLYVPLLYFKEAYIEYNTSEAKISIPTRFSMYSEGEWFTVNGNGPSGFDQPFIISNVDYEHVNSTSAVLLIDTDIIRNNAYPQNAFSLVKYGTTIDKKYRIIAFIRLPYNDPQTTNTTYVQMVSQTPYRIDNMPYGRIDGAYPVILRGGNLNNFRTEAKATYRPGVYRSDASAFTFTNLPSGVNGSFIFKVFYSASGVHTIQMVIDYSYGNVYMRSYSGQWSAWMLMNEDQVALSFFEDVYINYDTTNGTLTIPAWFSLLSKGKQYVVRNYNSANSFVINNVDYTSVGGTSALLLIDLSKTVTYPTENIFSVINEDTAVPAFCRIVARIRLAHPQTKAQIVSNSRYSIDGNPYGKIDEYRNLLYPVILRGGDLNNYRTESRANYAPGVYRSDASAFTFSNLPSGVTSSFLFEAYYSESGVHTIQIVTDYVNNKTYVRSYNGAWSAWVNQRSTSDVLRYSISSLSAEGENVGTTINVMSYNVANYTNDTASYIGDDKIYEFRRMLNDTNPEFIGLQEDRSTIDSNNEKTSKGYIFNPVYNYGHLIGEQQPSIRSKMNALDGGAVLYSNGRQIQFATYSINNKILLILSTHPVANYNSTGIDSEESIAAREVEYTELIQFAEREIQLENAISHETHYAPEHEWCIICGDFNTITDDDKENLTDIVTEAGYKMANGGRLGWLKTALRYTGTMTSLDNIICSPNVIINTFKSYVDWYTRLYSDHVPVMANLTLT